MNSHIHDYLIPVESTVRDALERMHAFEVPAVIVVDDNLVVKGIFTNGDMRRYFLRGGTISASIEAAMNVAPMLFYTYDEIKNSQQNNPYIVYPLVDGDGRIRDVLFGKSEDRLHNSELAGVPLVVMAGGKGTRLYPYTRILPKALVPFGNMTISERIIRQVYDCGCREIHFILNHKASMIRAYFDDIERDYAVYYYEEEEFLGTGGGLFLIKDSVKSTFILSNCDILINDDLACAFATHKEQGNSITFVCAMTNVTIPYGVVETNEAGSIAVMREKPEFSFLVNTGVYIVEPEVLDIISRGEFIHFPDIAQRCIQRGDRVGVFPVSENAWIDIGEINKMNLAIKNFEGEHDHAGL